MPFGAGLMVAGCDVIERHGVVAVAGEIEAGLDPAGVGGDQRDRETASALRQHGDVAGVLGERNAARAAGQGAVGAERDAVFRAGGRHGHRTFRRGDVGLRQ